MTAPSLPSYTHIPGVTPHPIRDPAGHSYAAPKLLADILEVASHPHAAATVLPPLTWRNLPLHPKFQWAVQLFNAGYYWEAHEAWEELWHLAGRVGVMADFLKGLIKLAAAGVKLREHNLAGVERHSRRAEELLQAVADDRDACAGGAEDLSLGDLIEIAHQLDWHPPPLPEDRTGRPVAALPSLPPSLLQHSPPPG